MSDEIKILTRIGNRLLDLDKENHNEEIGEEIHLIQDFIEQIQYYGEGEATAMYLANKKLDDIKDDISSLYSSIDDVLMKVDDVLMEVQG